MNPDFDRLNDNWKMYQGNPNEEGVEEEEVEEEEDPTQRYACIVGTKGTTDSNVVVRTIGLNEVNFKRENNNGTV
jgi:hypothetical protein